MSFTIDKLIHGYKIMIENTYSTHNKGNSVVAEKSIRTLINKIHKYLTSVTKRKYIDKLDGILNKKNQYVL